MINRKNRDVKFIIYQSLYIFVISVLALKGANLDLTEVVKKDKNKVEERKYTDSLRLMIDSLMAKGIIPEIKFDTSKKFTDLEELKKELAVKQQQLAEMRVIVNSSPTVSLNQTSPNIQINPTDKGNITERKKNEEETDDTKEQKQNVEFRVPQSFTQYTTNSVSNPSNETIEIYGSDGSRIASVPPGGSRSFTLGGQTSLTFKRGGVSKSVSTKENQKPKLLMQRLVEYGENVSVRKLQSTVGYRVTVNDDYPGQLDVNFSGPIDFKKVGTNVYDITLKLFGSKESFEKYTENRDSPYKVTFQVTVKDQIAAGQSVTQVGTFMFGEW
jgi:hypothetical protein